MSYNPRIKNISGGTVDISGSLTATSVSAYISASNANIASITANSISASVVDRQTSINTTLKSVKYPIRKISGSTNVQTSDGIILVNASSSNIQLTLPSASLVAGQRFTVKKTDSTSNVVSLRGLLNPSGTFCETDILSGSLAVDTGDSFAWSIAMNSLGDRIVVGVYQDEKIGGSASMGLAYVFISGSSGWIENAILSGSLATEASDFFGSSVSINAAGDRIVVGSSDDEKIGGASAMGLAYIFTSGSSGWVESAILSGSLAVNTQDYFGESVSINSTGNCIVVGARADEKIGGSGGDTGLAYVFISGSSGWTESAILSGSLATQTSDFFGSSVAMNSLGDRIVVTAYQDEKIGGSSSVGLAYIFTSGSSGWMEGAILSGSLATSSFDFGWSVAMNSLGDRIVVGAYQDEKIGGSSSMGLAYIFTSGSSGWVESAILSGSLAVNTQDYFGESVSINSLGDCIVVGATGDEKQGGAGNTGLAYVFISGSSGWTEYGIMSGSFGTDPDAFGSSVAMNSLGDRIVVGARVDEKIGVSTSAGLAYVLNALESLDGNASVKLSTQSESVTVTSDGTGSWSII